MVPTQPPAPQRDPHPPLVDAALAIAEEAAVDWDALLSSPVFRDQPDLMDLARRLRIVDRLVRGHDVLRSPALEQAPDLRNRTPLQALASDTAVVRWGPLIVRERIGSGSFGVVYRARDPRLDRDVALKVLDDDQREPDAVVAEARTLARVHHPNVVTVHGAERIDGRVGIWMEFIEGRSLAVELTERGRLPPPEAARVGIDVCRALAAVHAAGMLHRDVKAQNILRAASGRIVLGDFGTSIDLNDGREVGERTIAGTPLYLAPELFDGAPPSIASDLYSAGALLFFLLTGEFPVKGRTVAEVRQAHAKSAKASIATAHRGVPPGLAAIVDRLIDREPSRRFASASEIADALAFWVDAQSTPWIRRHAAVAAAVAVVTLAAVVWVGIAMTRPGSRDPRRGRSARLIENPSCVGTPSDTGWIACVLRPPGAPTPAQLVMYSVETGETRQVLAFSDRGPPDVMISPDSRRIAGMFPIPNPGPGNPPTFEIRVLDLARHDWRRLAALPADTLSALLSAWNRTDNRLAIYLLRRGMSSAAVALLSQTGALDVTFEFPVLPTTWGLSTDFRWLTFSSSDREIRVCDLQSGVRSSRPCNVVASHPATDFLPFFAPDGSLYFSSDRSGTIAVWRVELDGTRERGVPVLVRDTGRERLVPYGFDRSGDLYYILENAGPDVVEVDLKVPTSPLVRSLTSPIKNSSAPVWSADGSRLAYAASLGNYVGLMPLNVVIQSAADAAGESRREIPLPVERLPSARLAWSPDGSLMAVRGLSKTTFAVFVINPATGETLHVIRPESLERILEKVDDEIGNIAWLDGHTIAFSNPRGVGAVDIRSGADRSLWTAPATETVDTDTLALSPDANWLAVSLSQPLGEIRIVPVRRSFAQRPVLHHNARGSVRSWTADGAAILVVQRVRPQGSTPGKSELWMIPVNGAEPVQMPVTASAIYEVRAHRDGHRLAVSIANPRQDFFVGLGR